MICAWPPAGAACLSTWQRDHPADGVCERAAWEIESEVIPQLTPPLNATGERAHAL